MSRRRDKVRLTFSSSERPPDETGATLILALIFLVVVSLTVIGLVQWTGNDLNNTSKFVSAQSVQSAANSANQFAVQFVRYNFLLSSLDSSTPASCWTTGSGAVSQTSINNRTVDSWCMTRWYGGDVTSRRVVTISTCSSEVSASQCGLQPLLQTIVNISDGGSACFPVATPTSPNTCGNSLTIADWQFGASPPVINSASPGTFSCAAGSPVTLTGTNLALATDVDFVDTSQATPIMAPGTMASGATAFDFPSTSAATIQACTPGVLTSSSLYVIVSTPMGSNEYGPTSQWTSG